MILNEDAIDLIKEFEGLQLEAYKDAVGVWTIGYGHTSAAGEPFVEQGMKITNLEAGIILRNDLNQFEKHVRSLVRVYLDDNQYGALVCLCFNIGTRAFGRSTLLKKLNRGDIHGAADEFLKWKYAKKRVLSGLVRRREAERLLFLTNVMVAQDEAYERVTGGEAKPLVKSKTAWMGGGITVAGALSFLKDVREAVPEAAEYLPYALFVIGALIVINRWNESRVGEH